MPPVRSEAPHSHCEPASLCASHGAARGFVATAAECARRAYGWSRPRPLLTAAGPRGAQGMNAPLPDGWTEHDDAARNTALQ